MASEGAESDDELLARVSQGDVAAFSRLVTRHRRRLTALAARVVGRSGAEDVVQETFVRAWARAPAWRGSSAPADGSRSSYAAWLSRVAVNLCLDQTRKRPWLPIEAARDMPDMGLGPDGSLLADERRRCLEAAIATLPERQRVALSLTYDAELSNAEGARAMDISVGAFELILVRARRALRAALRDDEA